MQESKADLSRTELPRFGVIHLLALTATTALAALPYQLQLLWIRQSPDSAANSIRIHQLTPAMALYGASYCVATGALLFIATALLRWRRRRYVAGIAPGHLLAVQSAIAWLYLMLASMAPLLPWLLSVAFISSWACTIGYFIFFLGVAVWGRYSIAWRWTFAIVACEPMARSILSTVLRLIDGIRGTAAETWIAQAAIAAMLAIALAVAMASDAQARQRWHWSHWMAVGSRLLLAAGEAPLDAYIALAF